ncbi:ricin B lectin domain-containing protein [Mycena floridula]|nr:ricin B lectin domain-containing protein [Mycena floridula]
MGFEFEGTYYIYYHEGKPGHDTSTYGSRRIGLNKDGKAVIWSNEGDYEDNKWKLEPVAGKTDTYNIRNMYSGTYMDSGGDVKNGKQIVGYQYTGGGHQNWIIQRETSGVTEFYKIKNEYWGTFVDLKDGQINLGNAIVNWGGEWNDDNDHQLWSFEKA